MSPWVDRCRAHFERADLAARELARRTGLACPRGCGACCLSPDVETSVAEMRPMAAALAEAGLAERVLERVAALDAAGERRCALYEPEDADPRRGRCGAYGHRPLVCRLFAFSARRDRHGRPELVACSVMRAADPETVERARREVGLGAEAPVLGDHAHALLAENPGGSRQEPINRALRSALEGESLARRLAGSSDEAPESDDRRPDGPRPRSGSGPRRPRRAA